MDSEELVELLELESELRDESDWLDFDDELLGLLLLELLAEDWLDLEDVDLDDELLALLAEL